MMHVVLDGQMVTGAIIITVAAVIAMFFLLLTLLHILLALVIPAYTRRMSSPQERNFIMSPLGFYIICLFASNFISAMGGVMEARWVGARAITQGPACTTQAFMLQLGNSAAALWTAVISISALRTFTFRARSLSKAVTLPLIFVSWFVIIVLDSVVSTLFTNHSRGFFYGIAGSWCWITISHPTARLLMGFIWMWVWSLVSAVCFFLVFLSVRGNLTVKRDGRGQSIRWSRRAFNSYALGSGEEQYGVLVGTVGKTMCWFPISYITLTLPISVSRVGETFRFPIPQFAFVFSAVCLSLLGIVSPILYFAIRRSLKHVSTGIASDVTLRGSFGEKQGTESFQTPQGAHPPHWTPTPTTTEWVPPSPHYGVSEATSPSSASTYIAYRGSSTPLKDISLDPQISPRARSFHRPTESISTVTSFGTVVGPVVGPGVKLSPVIEAEPATESMKLQLALPPAALVARRQSLLSSNPVLPSDLDKFANVPLSPALRPGHRRSDTDASVYRGPRDISPDLNALLLASQVPTSPTGPPPPPRKIRRLPIPSVPVDVDESDQGSILSARPAAETFDPEDTRPNSARDVTSRKRVDSMRTFWAAYEGGSPKTPDMPLPVDAASFKRDTMRTFWAAYEDPSPTTPDMPMPSDVALLKHKASVESNVTSPDSPQFRRLDPSVSLKPSISAVGRAPAGLNAQFLVPATSFKFRAEHRRSRSFTPRPAPPVAAAHSGSTNSRSSNSVTALFHHARNAPTPTSSDMTHSSEASYRTPRPQPGYV